MFNLNKPTNINKGGPITMTGVVYFSSNVHGSLLSYITWPFTLKQNAGIHVLYSLLWASNAIASTLDTFQSFLFWFVCLLVYGSYFNYLMVWFWVSGEVLSDLPLISQYLVSKHTQTQMGKTPAPVVMDHYIFQRNNVSISHGRRNGYLRGWYS